MPAPHIGQTLDGRYALRERIGDGGTAAVFRADDVELGRTVAIKVYGPESELSDTARRQREARALAGLRHPAIVTLYDARLDAQPPYLVLEFVDGETLARRLRRGPLSAVETRAIGTAAASGLAAAHAAGVVHRDVKPANIMIPAEAEPAEGRLLDFGIAHSLGGSRATTTGSVLGSAVYLSPEQARGEEITPASDVYSLGLVLIECLTGRPAFTGSADEVLAARLVRPPALDDPALAADAPLLVRMTTVDPAGRPTAAEVEQELSLPAPTRVLHPAGADLPTERLSEAEAPAPLVRQARRRGPSRYVLAGAGAILLATLATVVIATASIGPGVVASPTPTTDEPVAVTPAPQPAEDDPPGNGGNAGNGNGDKKKSGKGQGGGKDDKDEEEKNP